MHKLLTSWPPQEKLFNFISNSITIWPSFFRNMDITNVFCAKKLVGHTCICPRMVTG